MQNVQPPREPSALGLEDPASPILTRIGTVFGGAVASAAFASLPAAVRAGDVSALRAFERWMALSAIVLPLAFASVFVFRRAKVGLRILVGERSALLAAAVLWWTVLELGALSVFAALLRAKTHHHGLAGVTFGLFALGSGVALALLAARGAAILARYEERATRLALFAAAAATLVALLLVGLRTAHAGTATWMIDALALAFASASVASRSFASSRMIAVFGVPTVAVVLAVGLAEMRKTPAPVFTANAPFHAAILEFASDGSRSVPNDR